jgi:hypothetical protein
MDNTASAVLLYTQDMMLAVIEERWDDLIEMQSVQDAMLHKLFAVNNGFSVQQKEDLFEVQRLNQEIVREVEAHKGFIASELRKMHRGKDKIGSYLSL